MWKSSGGYTSRPGRRINSETRLLLNRPNWLDNELESLYSKNCEFPNLVYVYSYFSTNPLR